MANFDEPDFKIMKAHGRVGIACQHLRDPATTLTFGGCYVMELPEGMLDDDVKLYYCPACESLGQPTVKTHARAYLLRLVGIVEEKH